MSLPHLLLGLLAEPASGYDLKKTFASTLRHFWAAELSQIYPALQQLERDGLLSSARAPSSQGPSRRVYHRTPAGRRALLRWLRSDPVRDVVRVPFLGQLCFLGEVRDTKRTRAFLLKLEERFRARLATLRAVESIYFPASHDASDETFHAHLTVRFGITRLKAAVAWCRESLARIPMTAARKAPRHA